MKINHLSGICCSVTSSEIQLLNKEKKSDSKVMFHVEANFILSKEESGIVYSSEKYFRKLFSINSINKCVEENCEYCCLSSYFCGSKIQCENSKETLKIFKYSFYLLVLILVIFFIYKIYLTDCESEHRDSDKIDEKSMNLLVSIFMDNRGNNRKT